MSEVAAPALAANLAVNYAFVAAFAFTAWETLISLEHEIEFIWSARHISPTKFPFLILRWYTLGLVFILQSSVTGLGLDSRFFHPPYCYGWFTFQVFSLQLITALQQYLMALRVFALYNRNRTLIMILGALLVVEQLFLAGSNLVMSLPGVQFSGDWCYPSKVPNVANGLVTFMILFDLLLLGLILLKAVRVWRAGGRVPLLSVVVRDGVWAFLVILSVFFLNNTIQWVLTPPLSSVIWPWQYAISAAASCRAVLQMQAEGGAPVQELMHTTEIDLVLTTFSAEPKREDQLRYRSSRWDESPLYD